VDVVRILRPLLLNVAAGFVAISLPAQAQAVPTACPAERAVYEMRTGDSDDVWRLDLVPARNMASVASDLYLRLATPERDYWFTFSVAQGYGGISILPITDPYVEPGPRSLLDDDDDAIVGWLRFLALDANLDIPDDPPNRGEEAPAYIILPEIGVGIWYDPAAFTGEAGVVRDTMPRGVFRRSACLVAPPPQALP
jgi:hypothetical protein